MNMLEKVARAIVNAQLVILCTDEEWSIYKQRAPTFYVNAQAAARAAIEAMRQPSDQMMDAPLGSRGDTVRGFLDMYDAEQVWQAMIDAALSEK